MMESTNEKIYRSIEEYRKDFFPSFLMEKEEPELIGEKAALESLKRIEDALKTK
jgi:hypothetical protein